MWCSVYHVEWTVMQNFWQRAVSCRRLLFATTTSANRRHLSERNWYDPVLLDAWRRRRIRYLLYHLFFNSLCKKNRCRHRVNYLDPKHKRLRRERREMSLYITAALIIHRNAWFLLSLLSKFVFRVLVFSLIKWLSDLCVVVKVLEDHHTVPDFV